MSLSRRIAMLFRAKANKVLDRAEDPREMLDYAETPGSVTGEFSRAPLHQAIGAAAARQPLASRASALIGTPGLKRRGVLGWPVDST